MEMMINYESRISKEKKMKRSLIIALVLLTATVTNAMMVLGVDGGPNPGVITLAPSDTFELSAVVGPGFGFGDFLISLSNAQGSLDKSGVEFSPGTIMYIPSYGDIIVPWPVPWQSPVPGLPNDAQHFSFGGGSLPPDVILYDEIIMWGLIFHCDEPTDVVVTLEEYLGAGQFVLLDEIIVHQIPEPATMLLLGVGGLLLRQRRK